MNKLKKKSVALFATMMVAVAAAGYVYQQNQAEESLLSELAMANVEALAQEEWSHWGDPNACPNGCLSSWCDKGCWCYSHYFYKEATWN